MVCGNGKNGQLGLTDNNGMPVVEVEQPQEGIYNTLIKTSQNLMFEGLMAVKMSAVVFWVVAPCSSETLVTTYNIA
jgi:hypothetical protein